jgi:hypothetical protein
MTFAFVIIHFCLSKMSKNKFDVHNKLAKIQQQALHEAYEVENILYR